jgi:hypothetical protein
VKYGYHLAAFALLIGVGGPYVALEYWLNGRDGRSAADLEIADRCVARAHRTAAPQRLDPPDLAATCDRYFRLRSEHEADEDEKRFRAQR